MGLLDVTPLSSIFDFGSKLIDKLIPDPEAKAKAQAELIKAQSDGSLAELTLGIQAQQQQTDVNKIEAASSSLFVSGWRPAIGWVCAASLATQFIGAPALAFTSSLVGAAFGWHIPAPPVPPEWTQLTPILMGMLGLGAMRTVEKKAGVAAK